jgi:hypothetical protein
MMTFPRVNQASALHIAIMPEGLVATLVVWLSREFAPSVAVT